MSLLLGTVIGFVIKFVALALIVVLAVLCGIKARKYMDKRKAEKNRINRLLRDGG